jgi:hypothetical protein
MVFNDPAQRASCLRYLPACRALLAVEPPERYRHTPADFCTRVVDNAGFMTLMQKSRRPS